MFSRHSTVNSEFHSAYTHLHTSHLWDSPTTLINFQSMRDYLVLAMRGVGENVIHQTISIVIVKPIRDLKYYRLFIYRHSNIETGSV